MIDKPKQPLADDSEQEAVADSKDNVISIVDGRAVRECLSMSQCIEAMVDTMLALYHGEHMLHQRLPCKVFTTDNHLLVMPGVSLKPAVTGVKTITLYPDNPSLSLPAIQGFITLFDLQTGRPLALIDAASITALRTAAASAAATQFLAREDASTLALIGTGVQAESHLHAMLAIRPINKVFVWGRNPEKGERLVGRMRQQHPVSIEYVNDIASAVCSADIICTLTGSERPLIKASWLKPGVHINLVGSHSPNKREVDSQTIKRSRLFVEVKSAALIEAGDILIPLQKNEIDESHILGEIGAVIAGDIQGRRSDHEITVYKSLGNAAQDLAAANAALSQAEKEKKAIEITMSN